MAQYKQSTSIPVLIKLASSSSGSPLAGVASSSITATAVKADGTTASISVTGANWSEITTGAFSGQGIYLLTIPNTATNVAGVFCYAVAASGATTYTGKDEIVANLEGDTYTRIGAPVGASISADIAQVETNALSANTKLGTPVGASISADIAGVRGAQNLDISTIAGGALFSSSTDTLHNIEGSIVSGGVSPTAIAAAVWDEATSSHTVTGTFGKQFGTDATNISAIKTKTDNLPSDPASNSTIQGSGGFNLTQIAGTGFLTGANSLVALTNIPQLVWQQSASSFTTSTWTGAVMNAINAKTVNLPSDPASNSWVTSARQSIMGSYNFGAGLSITDIAGGSSWSSSTDTLHNIEQSVTAGGIDPTPIVNAVWSKSLSSFASGTAGQELLNTYNKTANLPSDPASNSSVINTIRGGSSLSITDIAGSGWSSSADTLHVIKGTIPPTPPSVGAIAIAVWDESITPHTTAGTFGRVSQDTLTDAAAIVTTSNNNGTAISTVQTALNTALGHVVQLRRLGEGHWKIFTSGPDANRLVLYSNDGSTVLQKWDLKDQTGTPTTVNVFERVPTNSIP